MNELFNSTHDALTFAFNYSSQQYATSPMARMMKTGDTGTGKGLVSIDGAGQSGLIKAALSQMDQIKIHCLAARYLIRYTDCPCCGGQKPVQEWQEAVRALGEWAMSAFTGLSHQVEREAIVMNFYVRGVSMEDVATRVNTPLKTVYNHRAKIHAALKKLDSLAQLEISNILQSMELVIADETNIGKYRKESTKTA